MSLAEEHSVPPQRGQAPLTTDEAQVLQAQVPGWDLQPQALVREYKFRDFRGAMAFINRVAVIADAEDHHPDMCISYNRVKLALATHTIGGLSRNDFIVAAKIDRLEA